MNKSNLVVGLIAAICCFGIPIAFAIAGAGAFSLYRGWPGMAAIALGAVVLVLLIFWWRRAR